MNEWQSRPLAEVITLQRGHDLPAQDRRRGDVPIIGSFGVTGAHDEAKYAGPGVAIGRSGAAFGTATYVSGEYWPLNTCLFVRDFKANDPRWVFHLLDSMDFAAFNSGSAQPSLNRNFLRDIAVNVPPLTEQRAIAEVLGALDDKIAANTKLADTLAELISVKFTEASRSAIEAVKLSEIVTTQYGVTTSAHDGEGPKFLRVTDINKKPWITWDSTPSCTVNSDDLAKYRVEAGDILVARMADPGKAAFIDDGDPVAVFASYLVRLRAIDPDQSLYIYYFLRSSKYREYADGAMQGSVQMNMNAKVIVATDIQIPPTELVRRFNDTVGVLRKSIQAALRENQTLAVTRDTLLPQLMSGALRIKDAEQAIEEVV